MVQTYGDFCNFCLTDLLINQPKLRILSIIHLCLAKNMYLCTRNEAKFECWVSYCAQELFLSPNYFGDLIRQATGETATAIIRNFVMQRATAYLHDGKTISETSELLGFEYPQHFTRVFKKHFGLTPSEFLRKWETKYLSSDIMKFVELYPVNKIFTAEMTFIVVLRKFRKTPSICRKLTFRRVLFLYHRS